MARNVIVLLILVMLEVQCLGEDNGNKDLVVVPSESTNDSEEQDVERTSPNDDSNYDEFHATEQWQTVKEGQAIPPGLHVQIDLQSGEKRAKLMDEEQSGRIDSNHKENSQYSPKQKYIKIDKNIISKQKLKDALKDFKDKFHGEDEELTIKHEKNKYRSMNEIKQEFDGVNIWMKKDIDIIQDLVKKLNNSNSTKTELLNALEELEYLVHQIDNARDLDQIGGLQLIVNLLNQTDKEIQSQSAYVIGSAAQSNIPVQVSLLESGALQLLSRLLVNKESTLSSRKKAIYALSAMLRLFPKGTQRFLKIGGLSILASLFQDNENKALRIKALTLLVDLVTEQMDNIGKKAKELGIQNYQKAVLKYTLRSLALFLPRAPLLKAMYQEGWCELSASITTAETETKEKLLLAFQVLLPACQVQWKQDSRLRDMLKLWREEWQIEIREDDQDDTGYLETLVKLTNTIEHKFV